MSVVIPQHMQTPQTVQMIYDSYRARGGDGWRPHLGASLIGRECRRQLWYSFRWATKSTFKGRILRLFQTGDLEETRLTADLQNIGVKVYHTNPETGAQWQVKEDAKGFFGGSMDGLIIGLPEAPNTWHIVEYKTHGDRSYKDLVRKGVELAKPEHYAQMQIYMHLFKNPLHGGVKVNRAAYIAVNKNTDDIHFERIRYDRDFGEAIMLKAANIIDSPVPPPREYDKEGFACKWCDNKEQCWRNADLEANCRTCKHSAPGLWAPDFECKLLNEHRDVQDQKDMCGGDNSPIVPHAYSPIVSIDAIQVRKKRVKKKSVFEA